MVAQAVADNDVRVTRHREETLAAVNAAFTEAWGSFTQANKGGEEVDDTRIDPIHPDTVSVKGRDAHSLAAASITEGLGGGIVGEKELNADLLRMKVRFTIYTPYIHHIYTIYTPCIHHVYT